VDYAAGRLTQLEPGSLFAGYRIEGLLDRGGMGVVYKATDVDLDRTVALKIIAPEHTQNPDAVARFKSEARLAASLEHPNIVPIHRGGEVDGVLYLAMRFVPGTDLRQLLQRGPLELDQIRRVITSVAAGLDAAHARGLVHRDVKPANILIGDEGGYEQVYLTDFGLTKRLGSPGTLTRPGAWVGTPDYVAPEQIQAGKIDGRTDVYSLGCVLYEMLTGGVAFPRENDMAKLWAHVTDPPPPPSMRRPDLVKAFDEVVARATAKDPAERYSSASELAAAVDRAISEQEAKIQGSALQATRPAAAIPELPTRPSGPPPGERREAATAAPQPPLVAEQAATAPPPPPQPPPAAPPTTGGEAPSSGRRWPLVAALALLLGGAGATVALVAGSSDDSSEEPPGERVPATLSPVPTNNVDGLGNATLRLNGNVATVSLEAKGLLDGESHPMHIHAGERGSCPTVEAARNHNGNLSIGTLDGAPFYGSPRVSLTTRGDIGVASILEFARYPATGNITYNRTIRLRPRTVRFVRRNLAAIVVHGIDYDGNGSYGDTLGGSDLNPSLSAEATSPALCGELLASRAARQSARGPRGSRAYTASLGLPPGDVPPAGASGAFSLICHLGRTS
jgi:serine/threonine protein kinase